MITKLKEFNLFRLSYSKFFILLYFIILAYAFTFTLILKNFLPSLHAGHGLLIGDNILFHHTAIEMANNISTHGWSEWRIFALNTAATINVGITAIVYYFLSPNPLYILPINAFFQTLAAYFLYRIVYLLSSNKAAGYRSSLLFALFPTTLIWTSQLHKDGYSVVAWFLIVWILISPEKKLSRNKKIILHTISMAIIFITRPLYLNLALLLIFLDLLYTFIANPPQISKLTNLINLLVTVIFVASFYYFRPVINADPNTYDATQKASYTVANFRWLDGRGPVDRLFLQASSMRMNQIFFSGPKSNSLVDGTTYFQSKADFYRYIPRAAVITLLFPHPYFLFKIGNMQSYGLIIEMVIYYFFLLNLIILMCHRKLDYAYYRIILFALSASMFFTYISPILGSLHRVRYPFFCLLISLGLIATTMNWQKIKTYSKTTT